MSDWLPRRPDGNVVIVGAGKAAASMAYELEQRWSGPLQGTVVVPHGHSVACRYIDVIEASHPIPDESGVAATRAVLDRVSGLSEGDTVVCLLSGGGSSLLTLPLPGISLEEKQQVTSQLLRSGAPIHEINTVRKKLSGIKGGKLAAACVPANVVTLIISDVPGNDVSMVASGPTVADSTTAPDAIAILSDYGITVSNSVLEAMHANSDSSTIRIDADVRLLATSDDALQAAAAMAIKAGVTPYVLGDLNDDARLLATEHARLAIEIATGGGPVDTPCVILSGGETTVRLTGGGRGGRNGEYALALAIALDGHPAISALACDTDGIDGGGDNAGGFVFPDTLDRAATQSIDVLQLQNDNDSYRFFEKTGNLIVTGPTRTNVNDFRAILIGS
jgi:hydroxypyruvate reductase